MVNGLMQPILNKLLEIITKPIIDIMDKTFGDAIKKIEELKEKGVELKENANIEKLKEQQQKAKEELIKKTQARLKKFGSAMSLLIDGVKSLSVRLATIPAAIISATPVGPGVSPNLVLPLLQQLKGEGDNLSKVYIDVPYKIVDRRDGDIAECYADPTKAKELLNWEAKLGLEDMDLGEEEKGYVAGVLATITAAFGIAKTACMLVGSGVDGIEATLPEIEIPIDTPEYKASDCVNYISSGSESEKECKYCTKFSPTSPDKSIYDFQDTPEKTAQEQYDEWYAEWVEENRDSFTCNDCKFFKKR